VASAGAGGGDRAGGVFCAEIRVIGFLLLHVLNSYVYLGDVSVLNLSILPPRAVAPAARAAVADRRVGPGAGGGGGARLMLAAELGRRGLGAALH